ncbi:MAG: hypothetical protein DSZ35_11800 [Verrucomicrobia bacterium]|nr:MAG: hypothetical protein DSZ35_11800 [Verrucomicrobiota bacterium]
MFALVAYPDGEHRVLGADCCAAADRFVLIEHDISPELHPAILGQSENHLCFVVDYGEAADRDEVTVSGDARTVDRTAGKEPIVRVNDRRFGPPVIDPAREADVTDFFWRSIAVDDHCASSKRGSRCRAAGADIVVEYALRLDFVALENRCAQHHLATLFCHRPAVQPEGAHPFSFTDKRNKAVFRRAYVVVHPAHWLPAFAAVGRARDPDAIGVGLAADAIEPMGVEITRWRLDNGRDVCPVHEHLL